MPNIKRLLFYSLLVVIYILCFSDDIELVSAQDNGALSSLAAIVGPAIAGVPTAILSLFNLGLLSRLVTQDEDGDGEGLFGTNLIPGLGRGRKNMMLFMGRHNIQVSNHDMK